MKPLIICIVGASGSGKTTASLILQKQFDWNTVVSYTTRPMRKGEINGVDHWFVSTVPDKDKMCAYTKFGGYEYWTLWEQFKSIYPSVYVIDEKGLIDLQSKEQSPFSFNLMTIKMKRNDLEAIEQDRKDRDKERISLPDSFYDYIINNNGSIEQLRAQLYLIAQCIIQKTKDYGSTER